MRRLICVAATALWLVAASAAFASAEPVREIWRSPYGNDRARVSDQSFAVSPSDRSFWMISGANVEHYANDGTLLFRSRPLAAPWSLKADPVNGSCWVLQGTKEELLHFAADGTLLSATPGLPYYDRLLPSPADGSVWLSDLDHAMHVDASGAIVWTRAANAYAMAADPHDGSVWMREGDAVMRRSADGSEIWRATGFGAGARLGEDPRDQSVWVGDGNGLLAHLSATGQVLWQTSNGGARHVYRVEVLPQDGSLWVCYSENLINPDIYDPADDMYVARLDAAGTELRRYNSSMLLFANLHDGSAWVSGGGAIALYSADGNLLQEMDPDLWFLTFDPVDSGYWAAEDPVELDAFLARYRADGELLWTQPRPEAGWGLWPDPYDGSCWFTEHGGASVLVNVSPKGEELGRMTLPAAQEHMGSVEPLRFSATDDTWWARDGSALAHFAEDGTELWRQAGLISGGGWGPEVSPLDGSLWITSSFFGYGDTHNDYPANSHLVHLSADGTVLSEAEYSDVYFWGLAATADGGFWTVTHLAWGDTGTSKFLRFSWDGEQVAELPLPADLSNISSLHLNPSDGSLCGVASTPRPDPFDTSPHGAVFRMADDGTLLWQVGGFYSPAIALVPQDGSLWVADGGGAYSSEEGILSRTSRVVHLDANGQSLWQGTTFNAPAELQVNDRDGTVWLHDHGNRQVVHLGVTTPPFPDVSVDSWALDAIAACVDAGIVQGYWNGYRPDQVVTRDQMAVYISRALAGGDEGVQVPSGGAEPTFTDVDTEHWAYQYVEYCASASIVQGFPDGGYHPDEPVDRGQMAVYIARSQLTPSGDAALPDPPEEPTFADVTADNDWSWCYPHVEYCAAEGIVQGYADGYHPERIVTRDQMAVYIARAFNLPL